VRAEEPGALVGREPAGEADRQDVLVAAGPLAAAPEELALAGGVDPPELLVGQVADARPVAAQGLAELRGQPRTRVDAVRHVTDRDVLDRPVRPQRVPHLACDRT